jgi:NADH-quinone oxidoreductase subunit J
VGAVADKQIPLGFGSPILVGTVLFSNYLLPFEITSVLLLVAMIGAIVLTKGEKK